MRTKRWARAAAGSLILAALVGCRNSDASRVRFTQVERQEPVVAEAVSVVIENRVGDIRVTTGEAGEIRVRGEVWMEAARARTTPEGTFNDWVKLSFSGNTITVADAGIDRSDCRHWNVALTIVLPADVRQLQISDGVGTICVETAGAGCAIKSGVGDVTLRGSSGGDVRLTTGTGNVRLALAEAIGAIEAQTGVGNANVELDSTAGPVTITSGTGNIALTVGGSPPVRDVRLSSGVGDIRLCVPAGASGRFDLASGVGGVRVDRVFDDKTGMSHMKGSNVSFVVGSEGPLYHVRAGTGHIRVN